MAVEFLAVLYGLIYVVAIGGTPFPCKNSSQVDCRLPYFLIVIIVMNITVLSQ